MFVFLDDIKITAIDDYSHIQRVEVLGKIEKYNMCVNVDKSASSTVDILLRSTE